MRTDEAPVVVEQTFRATIEDVWDAITQVDRMTRWFFGNIPDFRPEVGFETRFDVESDGRPFPHVWTVTEVVPGRLIKYDWRYDGYLGDSFVTFELSGDGDATTLRVTHTVTESFPDDVPEFQRDACVGGWNYFVAEQLKGYLEQSD